MVGAPLAWAALLLFHPLGSGEVYDLLRDQVTRWQVVHVGTLLFIGLMGLAVFTLVRDLPGGLPAPLARGRGPSCSTEPGRLSPASAAGAIAQHTNSLPAAERAGGADAIQSLDESPIVGDFGLLGSLGSLGWVTAVLAAGVALRTTGASRLGVGLLGVSALAVQHPPPVGPIALACFAAAVLLIYRGARVRA